MTRQEFNDLKVGDLVRHKSRAGRMVTLVVTGHYGDHVTAIDTHDLTNPGEWDVVSKAGHVNPSRHCGSFESHLDDPLRLDD